MMPPAREALYLFTMVGKVHDNGNRGMAIRKLDAYRAEVLAEAASLADPKKPEVSFFGDYGPQVAWWLRMLVGRREKSTATSGDATPDFFQPGHTYTDDEHGWKFRVDTITTHPDNGELTALGWRFFNNAWEPIAYHQDDWEVHQAVGHTDVTEAGEDR